MSGLRSSGPRVSIELKSGFDNINDAGIWSRSDTTSAQRLPFMQDSIVYILFINGTSLSDTSDVYI
jgi:high-affinity nickel permease